ncbi:hypothetical protein I545_1012 [Mycobacterium kansasii 662]|uniref:Uncharacterized protein n=3 Tax=Mycobacterium kansasii TaxID=1768 RepID=A0A1V3XZ49_MYCKA|nr:hypothetical protein I547_0238 [Mycobacterium kansasii 824]EUA22087.1 hypothetical protein I545_1012 [Mycobacterium kansasii 662]OOK84539.1 hypothetical protein BZL29_1243 [Mycobacterium kansasii]
MRDAFAQGTRSGHQREALRMAQFHLGPRCRPFHLHVLITPDGSSPEASGLTRVNNPLPRRRRLGNV